MRCWDYMITPLQEQAPAPFAHGEPRAAGQDETTTPRRRRSSSTSAVGASQTNPRQTYAAPPGRSARSGESPVVTTTAPGDVVSRAVRASVSSPTTATSSGPAVSASPTAAAQPA